MKEATNQATDPPHASNWPQIRLACRRYHRAVCGYNNNPKCRYPWCTCPHVAQMEAELAGIEAAKARGEAA